MQNSITVPTLEQIEQLFRKVLNEQNTEKKSYKVLSKNQARVELGIGYNKLNKLIKADLIKTTADGKITELEINRYLGTV